MMNGECIGVSIQNNPQASGAGGGGTFCVVVLSSSSRNKGSVNKWVHQQHNPPSISYHLAILLV